MITKKLLTLLSVTIGLMGVCAPAFAGFECTDCVITEMKACGDVQGTFYNSSIGTFVWRIPATTYNSIAINGGNVSKVELNEYNNSCIDGGQYVHIDTSGNVYVNNSKIDTLNITQK